MRFNSSRPTWVEANNSTYRIIKTYNIFPKRILEGPYRWLEKSFILQKATMIYVNDGMHKHYYWCDVRWAMHSSDFQVLAREK